VDTPTLNAQLHLPALQLSTATFRRAYSLLNSLLPQAKPQLFTAPDTILTLCCPSTLCCPRQNLNSLLPLDSLLPQAKPQLEQQRYQHAALTRNYRLQLTRTRKKLTFCVFAFAAASAAARAAEAAALLGPRPSSKSAMLASCGHFR
jgi:hypothetical protein